MKRATDNFSARPSGTSLITRSVVERHRQVVLAIKPKVAIDAAAMHGEAEVSTDWQKSSMTDCNCHFVLRIELCGNALTDLSLLCLV